MLIRWGILLALSLVSACGGAEGIHQESSTDGSNAPRKVLLRESESADGPTKLSTAELKAMGITPKPTKFYAAGIGERRAAARSVCSEPARAVRPGRPVTIPLAHPLTGTQFSLDACVVGEQRVPLRYIVDSGADSSSIDEGVAVRAGLQARARRGYVVDANGVRQRLRTVEPQVLQFSDLQMSSPELGLSRGHALAGQDLLNQFSSWMLDHDAGLLRLGMRPPSHGFLTRASLKKVGSWPGNYIQVRIAGRTFIMKLDTGAFSTSISREVAESLRLPKRKGRPSAEITGGVHSRTIVRASYEANIEIGGLVFEDVEIMPLPAGPKRLINRVTVSGLLGADVLLRHNIVVRPHKDISFYEREPTEVSAALRVGRWAWVPMCEGKLACAQARVSRRSALKVTLALEENYPQAAEFLFACANRSGEVSDALPYLELSHPEPRKGETAYSITRASRQSVRAWSRAVRGRACAQLQLIDVQAPEPGRTAKVAQLRLSSRHWLR